jgi:hypothetical protein
MIKKKLTSLGAAIQKLAHRYVITPYQNSALFLFRLSRFRNDDFYFW